MIGLSLFEIIHIYSARIKSNTESILVDKQYFLNKLVFDFVNTKHFKNNLILFEMSLVFQKN